MILLNDTQIWYYYGTYPTLKLERKYGYQWIDTVDKYSFDLLYYKKQFFCDVVFFVC